MREDIVARGGSSKAEGVHFGLFVGVALAGIAEGGRCVTVVRFAEAGGG